MQDSALCARIKPVHDVVGGSPTEKFKDSLSQEILLKAPRILENWFGSHKILGLSGTSEAVY